MIELPKKIQDRIIELQKAPNRNIFPQTHVTVTIAQELYADLAMAMDTLEKIARDMGTDYSDGNTLIANEALAVLRAKYNDQETEGGE